MIKLMPPSGGFHNFKCGEVFCLSHEEYNIACCLCGLKVELIDFPLHFQEEHLSGGGCSSKKDHHTEATTSRVTRSKTANEPPKKSQNQSTEIVNVKAEVNEIEEEIEEVSAFSWGDHFQDDEMPIDMEAVENASFENVNTFEEKQSPMKNTNFENVSVFEKELNNLENIGEQGAKVTVYGGDEDDDIDIGVNDDEWLHDLYTYDNVVSPSDDEDSVDIPLEDNKDDVFEDIVDNSKLETTTAEKPTNSAECDFCERTFYSEVGLKIHMKAVHEVKQRGKTKSKKKSSAPPETFSCDQCGDKFASERQLLFHGYRHTGIFCEICGKKFTQVGNLLRHKIRHTGVKSMKCTQCDAAFFTDKELNAHMIRHTGIHPHICEVCGKQCRDRGVLTAHMRRHTGERPAKCGVCGKSFFCGYDLNVHSVTHSTERPFKCDICGSTFQLKKSLRVHKKIHSKNRDHVCKICGKGFAQSSGLQAHMRMHDTAKLYERGDSVDNVIVVATTASSAAIEDLTSQQSGPNWSGLGIM